VKVFDGITGAELRSFFAFPGFNGGVSVAAAGFDVIVGTGSGASHIKVVSALSGEETHSFMVFDGFTGGVSVGTVDRNADGVPDILIGARQGGGPRVKIDEARSLAELDSFFAFDALFSGGVFVG
jgi:hypothetical protein